MGKTTHMFDHPKCIWERLEQNEQKLFDNMKVLNALLIKSKGLGRYLMRKMV